MSLLRLTAGFSTMLLRCYGPPSTQPYARAPSELLLLVRLPFSAPASDFLAKHLSPAQSIRRYTTHSSIVSAGNGS